jgi:hypothetical protein
MEHDPCLCGVFVQWNMTRVCAVCLTNVQWNMTRVCAVCLTNRVEAKMDKLTVLGSPQQGVVPKRELSQNAEADQVYSLLDMLFETNPLDGLCDTRLGVKARPLQIVYDAVSEG